MKIDDEDSGDKRELKGYGHPPKQHQWPKGKSGNPRGRPKKKRPDYRIGSLLSSVERETVEINGIEMPRREIVLRQLYNKVMKGDLAAMRILFKLWDKFGMLTPPEQKRGGVLVVPLASSYEEWERFAEESQRQYREEQSYSDYG